MEKKRIVWLCNAQFTDEKIRTTASWLQPLAEHLQNTNEILIFNITIGNVAVSSKQSYKGIEQWILPPPITAKHGQVPCHAFCEKVAGIINQIEPDLVHIWGTESVWASVYEQGYIQFKCFVDIQGVLSSSYYYYYGGLSFTDIIKCVHTKEIIMPWRTLFNKKRIFRKRGEIEIKCLKSFSVISYQSEWVRRQLQYINPHATYVPTRIMLRDAFYSSDSWKFKIDKSAPILFTTASGAIPYKGIHVVFKAVQLLKRKYPRIALHVAGNMSIGNRLQDGFSIYIKKLIHKLGISENVVLLGSINDEQIVDELQSADVAIIPSFVETYCLAFAEAMIVGAPTVASYAGAMPELATHGEECLFYNSIDFPSCAAYIDELIKNRKLAEYISTNARKRRMKENNQRLVIETQLANYNKIINI